MTKITTLRNILAFCSLVSFASCNNGSEDMVDGHWQVQSLSSPSSFATNIKDQNLSLNVNQASSDGSSVVVSDASGEVDQAAVRFKSGNDMIVEYRDPQTGEKVLVQMKKN